VTNLSLNISKPRKKLKDDFRSEQLDEQSRYEDFGKIFKPITEQQQKSSEYIISKFAPLQEAVENIPASPWDQAEEGQALPQPDLVAIDVPQILPSDPNALCERLELSMASKQVGNTGFRNEIVSICDELLRQKILFRDACKNLMLALNK